MFPLRYALAALTLSVALTAGRADGATNDALPGFNWPVGEKITYRIYWGYIPVGTATGWTEWSEYKGRPALAIRLRTLSNKFVEKLYPVDDTIESLVDPETFLPFQFTKNLREGQHRNYEITTFDYENLVAHWESRTKGKTNVFALTPGVRDIPSLMYFLRTRAFVPGSREHFTVMADDKIYDLWLNVQKKERVKLPLYGAVDSIKAEPEAAFEGLFVRRGRLWIWISDDRRCLATQIVGSVPVATVRAVLWQVEGPGDDSWIRKAPDAPAGPAEPAPSDVPADPSGPPSP